MKMKSLFNPLVGRRWLSALAFTACLCGIASVQASALDASVPAMRVNAYLAYVSMQEQECQLDIHQPCPSILALTWTPSMLSARRVIIEHITVGTHGREGLAESLIWTPTVVYYGNDVLNKFARAM